MSIYFDTLTLTISIWNIYINPLAAGPDYIHFLIFYQHNKFQRLNMLKIKRDITPQNF